MAQLAVNACAPSAWNRAKGRAPLTCQNLPASAPLGPWAVGRGPLAVNRAQLSDRIRINARAHLYRPATSWPLSVGRGPPSGRA